MPEIKNRISPYEMLASYGSVNSVSLDGNRVLLLPGSSTPLEHLAANNWLKTVQMGNARSVRSIDMLSDGTDPALVVKSPERIFTTSSRRIDQGEVWWGGPKSGEGKVRITGHSTVEEQSAWEAVYLLELQAKGVPAEVPQALIINQDGSHELVVARIDSPDRRPLVTCVGRKLAIERTSLVPVDSSEYNCMSDKDGAERVIDVNRWLWPGLTDGYREELASQVKRAALLNE